MTTPYNGDGNDDEDEYFLPLQDQRVFGAGIRKKRVPFVRSSDLTTTASTSPATSTSSAQKTTGQSIADRYLSLVLDKQTQTQSQPDTPTTTPTTTTTPPNTTTTCEICNLPLPRTTSLNDRKRERERERPRPHEASLAHQACLTHSHPPSHLDRTRAGMRYLAAYGWDPDSRLGLGASGREGIREPVKGKVKVDTVGLGAVVPSSSSSSSYKAGSGSGLKSGNAKGVQKLNAKEVRKGQTEERRRGERLREMFFQREDVLGYLG
ncbi:hypothetical protein BO71DRAFT_404461 [Aspergillus ellipticus CBS 707.79]|uniref:G-patch domain-containing protein n=1 Tax=Aspergillus ellipticus CBS 707.79 TaxID=1448320 RepID=A0A319CZ78_9EURO|nr:hypothetical protein BO71DRAFT_404461 [Aspergillus ellipticus CBS 707.79]